MVQVTRIDAASDPHPLTFRVNRALRSNPYLVGSNIHFTAREGNVTLRGTAQSFYQKQVAQETVRLLNDVKSVQNSIEVSHL